MTDNQNESFKDQPSGKEERKPVEGAIAEDIDNHERPRYTTRRLRYEIERAVQAERERCAEVARNACLVLPDGGSPTEEERLVCEEAARRIMGGFDGPAPSLNPDHPASVGENT